jgi:hypothetical protein
VSLFRRVTGWTAGVRFPAGAKLFSSPQRPDSTWGPPSLLYNGYRDSFPGKSGRGVADHSTPPSVEVNIGGAITSLPHTSLWTAT